VPQHDLPGSCALGIGRSGSWHRIA
jgi:hypothetical protein